MPVLNLYLNFAICLGFILFEGAKPIFIRAKSELDIWNNPQCSEHVGKISPGTELEVVGRYGHVLQVRGKKLGVLKMWILPIYKWKIHIEESTTPQVI